jgi:hypothetical protein
MKIETFAGGKLRVAGGRFRLEVTGYALEK